MSSSFQQNVTHISVSSFDGLITEVGTLGSTDYGYVVRCRRAPHGDGELLDCGAIQDPMLFSGFRYQDGQWSFVIRKHSQTKD